MDGNAGVMTGMTLEAMHRWERPPQRSALQDCQHVQRTGAGASMDRQGQQKTRHSSDAKQARDPKRSMIPQHPGTASTSQDRNQNRPRVVQVVIVVCL